MKTLKTIMITDRYNLGPGTFAGARQVLGRAEGEPVRCVGWLMPQLPVSPTPLIEPLDKAFAAGGARTSGALGVLAADLVSECRGSNRTLRGAIADAYDHGEISRAWAGGVAGVLESLGYDIDAAGSTLEVLP